jgi:hypothetical protein
MQGANSGTCTYGESLVNESFDRDGQPAPEFHCKAIVLRMIIIRCAQSTKPAARLAARGT